MLKVIILGSGSGGNSTYIESNGTKILIDCGLSKHQIKNRLLDCGIYLSELDAIFITHEHSDHIKEISSILALTGAKLYINQVTYRAILNNKHYCLPNNEVKFIEPLLRYDIKDLSIIPLELSHDTPKCMGYMVKELNTDENNTYAQITDTGVINLDYMQYLSYMNTVMIESNHDLDMERNSPRPSYLVDRVLSDHGHLSNIQCLEYVKMFYNEFTKRIILGHISKDCNTHSIALNNIKDNIPDMPFELFDAKQDTPLEILIGEEHD